MRLRQIAHWPMPLFAAPLLLALCGCDYFSQPAPAASGDGGGEVLEGSISDGMIPTDTLTSQPPILDEPVATGGSGGSSSGADNAGDDTAAEPAADAPAEAAADKPARRANINSL